MLEFRFLASEARNMRVNRKDPLYPKTFTKLCSALVNIINESPFSWANRAVKRHKAASSRYRNDQ
jgi:hypothetical protein